MQRERLCVVLPVYNERDVIGKVLEKWNMALSQLGMEYEIRVYNDGSKDDTLAVIQEVSATLGSRVVVRDKPNSGHGPTILQGYSDAVNDGFDWIFQVDSDDEMGPESFAKLWQLRQNYDFLVGRRIGRQQGLGRRVVSATSRFCVKALYGADGIWDVNTPYRLMRTEAFSAFYKSIPPNTFAPNVILSGLAARHALRSIELPVPQHNRTTGEVSIQNWKLLKAAGRSFGQTVRYGMRECLPEHKWLNWIALLSVLSGLFLTLFFGLSMGRASSVIAWLLAWWWVSRNKTVCERIRHLSGWVEIHPVWGWGIVLSMGTLERWFSAWRHGSLIDQSVWSNRGFDYIYFWNAAQTWGLEHFWVSKSWVTVWFYGSIIKLFGADLHIAYWGTAVLYILAAFVSYALVRPRGGKMAGLLAAFMIYASPALVRHSANIASEHLFVLTVLVSLWLASRCARTSKWVGIIAWGIAAGLGCWLATWSRGEGIILWLLLPLWTFACQLRRKPFSCWWRKGLLVLAVFGVVFVSGALKANQVNLSQNDMGGIFCSNDNYWPRLMGASKATHGIYNSEDKELIFQRCRAIDPERAESFPESLWVPVVREEIHRRWQAMTIGEAMTLMWEKARNSWCSDLAVYEGTRVISHLVTVGLTYMMPGLCLLFAWIWFWGLLQSWLAGHDLAWTGVLLVIPFFATMQFGMLLITESMWRYGYLFHVFWGMFGALGLACLRDRKHL